MPRWTFTDPHTHEVYTFPISPNQMSSPLPSPNAQGSAAGMRTGTTAPSTLVRYGAPVEWTFSGFLRTAAHHDTLKAWQRDRGAVLVTDHLGRTFECYLEEFAATERKTNRRTPDRWQYTMKALVLRQTA